MKKIIFAVMFLLTLTVFSSPLFAQGMMGGYISPSPNDQSQTLQDEAAGKAVWDKLQNKQVICNDLKDDDFDVLGDFFMGDMMGSNHTSMNQLMVQRLGQNGEKQMHIAMGKRLSGCDSNASFPQGSSYFMPMMGFGGMMGGWNLNSQSQRGGAFSMMGYNGYGNMMGGWSIFGLITWIALLLFLVLGIAYFWKEITKKK